MGQPIKIADLARDMIELSGLKVGEDIESEYTSLRPGERLPETLFTESEKPRCTQHEKIFVSHNGVNPKPQRFEQRVETLVKAALAGEGEEARGLLRSLAGGEETWPT